ncbi:hypothetical protein MRX96_002432 [Rhipicephalus microplus]
MHTDDDGVRYEAAGTSSELEKWPSQPRTQRVADSKYPHGLAGCASAGVFIRARGSLRFPARNTNTRHSFTAAPEARRDVVLRRSVITRAHERGATCQCFDDAQTPGCRSPHLSKFSGVAVVE